MKRWTVRLAAPADQDLAQILAYTKDVFGRKQATVYKATLLATIVALRDGPDQPGSCARDDIAAGLSMIHVARRGRRGRHFIIYRAEPPHTIRVLRILHDAMDLVRHVP